MARKLTEVMYLVQNLDQAISFYTEHVGCTVVKKHDWGFAYLEIEPGKNLGLMSKSCFGSNLEAEGDRFAPRLCFATDDLDAEVQRLTAAGVTVSRAGGKKGETRAVNFYDVDGNAIFLWEDGSGTLPHDAS